MAREQLKRGGDVLTCVTDVGADFLLLPCCDNLAVRGVLAKVSSRCLACGVDQDASSHLTNSLLRFELGLNFRSAPSREQRSSQPALKKQLLQREPVHTWVGGP